MFNRRVFTIAGLSIGALTLGGCAGSGFQTMGFEEGDRPKRRPSRTLSKPDYRAVYGEYPGEKFPIQPFDYEVVDARYLRQTVEYPWKEPVGSIVVDPGAHHLYFVEAQGRATRYGVGVGREGFGWAGGAKINMKRDWPDWIPPKEMVARDPEIRERLVQTPRGLGVPGGLKSPLGSRAMYLFDDGGDLGYRIHGTTEPETVGTNVSSGCIRMINQDIAHLYTRAALGTPVTVLS